MARPAARRTIENAVRRLGFARVAGVDEVGRGCLAGPVVTAAVVLDPARHVPGVRDSKLLTAAARERLYDRIVAAAAGWGLAWASPATIDQLNIHRATLFAMQEAVMGLVPLPDFVLVDGFRLHGLALPQRRVVGGDRRCAAIAAASIVAKVTRDRYMRELHDRDPRYGFDRHKGYATAAHLAAVSRFGYSGVHRQSFRPPSLFDTLD
ncbi:MAG: ribonuclease HII [Vicinamibacterales bacterium]|jgi:ribonuclease HII|nr:ribonuclease HII [Acidobacteriota bacterium]MDP6373958.1 ribonuclease HII [Vicinamibacterales bacterium]MDP6609463.1 ribonuclease HII [Vicinamibacterales bacterium]HAK56644.1 ribonuclease HII [Acidobacteriota bacterium]|tara:strand:- start:969 stop:1592 length:624 start_codon:yes stop_codon:yes gene_type:complete